MYEEYEEPLVRRHVAWALGEMGTSEALNALREHLPAEPDAEVREEIEVALTEVSTNNKRSVIYPLTREQRR